jgi:hypothetical protein
MPRLRAPGTERLALPSDPEAWVEMKMRATFGDVSHAQKATLEITTEDARQINGARRGRAIVQGPLAITPDFDGGAYLPALLERMIVAWNYTDDLDQPLPITRANLALLDAEDAEFLQAEAQRRAGGRPQDQQDPSRKPSSDSSLPIPERA